MIEKGKQAKDYVGYEYKKITVEEDKIAFYLDAYENFGWILDETTSDFKDNGKSTLRMKRDRKIINKTELTRLQKHFEDCMSQIEQMENQKTQTATMVSLAQGIIGTAFIIGSVFAVSAEPPQYILCAILGLPGMIGWILPVFSFKRIRDKKAVEINPLIAEKEDEIYKICEKGHGLLL